MEVSLLVDAPKPAKISVLSAEDFFVGSWEVMRALPRDFVGFLEQVKAHHGDAVLLQAFGGLAPFLFLSDPHLYRELFVKNNQALTKYPAQVRTFRFVTGPSVATASGEEWRQLRHEANQLFSRPLIERLGQPMVEAAAGLAEVELGEATGAVEGGALSKRLAAATTGRAILGRPVDDAEVAAMLAYSEAMRERFNVEARQIFALPDWMLAARRRKLKVAAQALNVIVRAAVATAWSQPDASDGLLSASMAGDDFTGQNEQAAVSLASALLAGALDNNAAAIAWWLAHIAHHPEWQERASAECAGERDLDACPTLLATVQESLRLRPPAAGNQTRTLAAPATLGGQTLAKGTMVMVSFWNMHHDRRWFAEPERFEPDRFLSGDAARQPAFCPFGHGPRNCVAQALATRQMLAIGAALLRRFRIAIPGDGAFPEFMQNPFIAPEPFEICVERL